MVNVNISKEAWSKINSERVPGDTNQTSLDRMLAELQGLREEKMKERFKK